MANFKVANRYANSLIDSAIDKNNLDSIYNDIKLLLSAFDISKELKHVFVNPVIKPETKKTIIDEIFKNKVENDTLHFIHFVIDKHREEILYEIAQRFLILRNEHLGIVSIEVKSAFDITDEQKQAIKERFKNLLNKKINLTFKIDKNIIGGFVARVGDTVYDGSVKHQLERLKNNFVQGGLSLN